MTALFDTGALTADWIKAVSTELFGLDVTVGEVMAGEFAVNVVVTPRPDSPTVPPAVTANVPAASAAAPTKYVLKLEPADDDVSLDHFRWLADVQSTAATLPAVANQHRARDGALVATTTHAGHRWACRLQDFVPGTLLAEAICTPALAADLGRTTADLVAALAHLSPEPVPARHDWAFETTGRRVLAAADAAEATRADSHRDSPAALSSSTTGVDAIADATAAAETASAGQTFDRDIGLIRYWAHRFETEVAPVLADLPHQVVHQDVNDFNVFVTGERVTGVIDFGDARHAPRIAEAAIACAYLMITAANPPGARLSPADMQQAATRARDDFLAAYTASAAAHGLAPSETELALVHTAALTRMCLNTGVWTERNLRLPPDSPAADYGKARMARTAPVIAALTEQEPGRAGESGRGEGSA